jgi:hypothetical protein
VDDIGADIAAVMKGGADAGTQAPAADLASHAEAAAPAGDKPGRERDDNGRFARAAAAVPEGDAPAAQQLKINSSDQPNAAVAEAPSGEPIRPPASWSPASKAKFATLDPDVQAEIAKREQDMAKGVQDWAAKLKRVEPLEQVLAPHLNRLAMNGVDGPGYVRSLIAADEALRGPQALQAIHQLARMYGINLQQPLPQGQQPPQGAQLPQEFHALSQQVATLQSAFSQQQTAAQQADEARVQEEIAAFARDHLYYENVKPEMIALLKGGVSDNLADAYRRACWARDDIRPLLLKEEADKQAAAARAKANEAKQASGSITGSPAPGAAPPSSANSNGSIEDDLRAAWRQAAGA